MGASWDRDELRRVLKGRDEQALRQLLLALTPWVQREVAICLVRAAPARRDARQELEDLTHDVLAGLLARDGAELLAWDPERGLAFPSFVRLKARQKVGMVLRSGRRSPWRDLPCEIEMLERTLPPEPPRQHARAEAREALGRIFGELQRRLDPRGKQLFERLYVEEAGVDEVCEDLSMSRDAVYAWRKRFRRLVAEMSG